MTYKVIVRPEAAREIQEALIDMKDVVKDWGLTSFAWQMRVYPACSVTRPLIKWFMREFAARFYASFLTHSSISSRMTLSLCLRVFISGVVRPTGSAERAKFNAA